MKAEFGPRVEQINEVLPPREQALVESSARLQEFLGKNIGSTADWPISLVAKDPETSIKLLELLNAHAEALHSYFKEVTE